MNRTRNLIKCYALTDSRREISLRRFSSLRMIHICTFAFRLTRDAVFDKS